MRSEYIYEKASRIVSRCGTRDTLEIAEELGIYVDYIDGLDKLLGMYTYQNKERHILLNSNMDDILTGMVCGHEIGHDILHREYAKSSKHLPEFVLFDIRNRYEYEANAFAAHLMIDDDELADYVKDGYDVVQIAQMMNTNVNMMLIKLNEMNQLGWKLKLPYIPRGDFLKSVRPEM